MRIFTLKFLLVCQVLNAILIHKPTVRYKQISAILMESVYKPDHDFMRRYSSALIRARPVDCCGLLSI